MEQNKITEESIMFFIEMVKSSYGQPKGYYKFIKDIDSDEYKTFTFAYVYFRKNLAEREKKILDLMYCLNTELLTLKDIGERMGITGSRVSSIRNLAERRLSVRMLNFLNGHTPRKKSLYSIIRVLPDEELIKLLQATRPWETVIQHFAEVGQLSTARRKRVIHLVYRVWDFDMLDHREKIIKLLKIEREQIHWS
ncbi:sigma factor-like helix-turn-helix DNA-binding protein [Rossellomorea aquimaris]|uniref:sigma factor-like helix-turn-helix DNA-binding protein n=1 Tax=Rossellomorea aquimaris TaxID=189382 RepID=UPI0011E9488F|nr:sigma factor-like helix-turn-helix DNA-binding protein [Rossellomorea aquimaris]TYS83523.1 hypothetical protein FZC88_23455 [Rossellomorea aquimaris]